MKHWENGGRVNKQEKYDKFEELWERANNSAQQIAEEMTPRVMIVAQHANMLDDTSPVTRRWIVPDGPCGFAWVAIKPGNCSFAQWAKKYKDGYSAYYGGVHVSINEYNQSFDRKMAHARAMAEVLRRGLEELDPKADVYADGRLD